MVSDAAELPSFGAYGLSIARNLVYVLRGSVFFSGYVFLKSG